MITLIANDSIQYFNIPLYDKIDSVEGPTDRHFQIYFINDLTKKEKHYEVWDEFGQYKERAVAFQVLPDFGEGFFTYIVTTGDNFVTKGRLQVISDSYSQTKVTRYEGYDIESVAYNSI